MANKFPHMIFTLERCHLNIGLSLSKTLAVLSKDSIHLVAPVIRVNNKKY